MATVEDFSQRVKEQSIKEYAKISENLMEKYSYNNPKIETEENLINYEDEMTKTKADYFLKKKKDIEQYFNKTKKLMKTMKNFNPQKAIIKIDNTEFRNPVDSLGLILKNKTIHDKVLDSYQDRELQTFGNNIRKINKIKGTLNLSKNVKITNIFNFVQSKLNNENNNVGTILQSNHLYQFSSEQYSMGCAYACTYDSYWIVLYYYDKGFPIYSYS